MGGEAMMRLRSEAVIALTNHRGWSQNELARQMGISKSALSRALSGKSGAGRKIIGGLLRIFPGDPLESLVAKEKAGDKYASSY
jgi:transcriptional regulator with XRE-family HTH domain